MQDRPPLPFSPVSPVTGGFVPDWLLSRPEISFGAKVVYGKLFRLSNKHGYAYPKQATLASMVGGSVPMVRRYLKELREYALISSVQKGYTNCYRLLSHPWCLEWSAKVEGDQICAPRVIKSVHPINTKTETENSSRGDCCCISVDSSQPGSVVEPSPSSDSRPQSSVVSSAPSDSRPQSSVVSSAPADSRPQSSVVEPVVREIVDKVGLSVSVVIRLVNEQRSKYPGHAHERITVALDLLSSKTDVRNPGGLFRALLRDMDVSESSARFDDLQRAIRREAKARKDEQCKHARYVARYRAWKAKLALYERYKRQVDSVDFSRLDEAQCQRFFSEVVDSSGPLQRRILVSHLDGVSPASLLSAIELNRQLRSAFLSWFSPGLDEVAHPGPPPEPVEAVPASASVAA